MLQAFNVDGTARIRLASEGGKHEGSWGGIGVMDRAEDEEGAFVAKLEFLGALRAIVSLDRLVVPSDTDLVSCLEGRRGRQAELAIVVLTLLCLCSLDVVQGGFSADTCAFRQDPEVAVGVGEAGIDGLVGGPVNR